jgi:mannosyltransferase
LVPPGDVEALVKALEPLMADPARAAKMGLAARERVMMEFAVDAEVEKIASFYQQVWKTSAAL